MFNVYKYIWHNNNVKKHLNLRGYNTKEAESSLQFLCHLQYNEDIC